jgi:cephalosporin-C deacetylase-like acetyl esterase
VKTHDVQFNGYRGQPINAWFHFPQQSSGSLPFAVEFISYGGGRDFPLDWHLWDYSGYAQFVMDTRNKEALGGKEIHPIRKSIKR